MIFLDANYFLRYIVQPNSPETQAMHEATTALFQAAARQTEEITTSEAVFAEVAYLLNSKRHYGLAPADIAARLKPILLLRTFKHPQKRQFLRALDVWTVGPTLGFEDALTVAYLEHQAAALATFDTDFDDIAGLNRYQPEALED